jgi:hypothetical protein
LKLLPTSVGTLRVKVLYFSFVPLLQMNHRKRKKGLQGSDMELFATQNGSLLTGVERAERTPLMSNASRSSLS